MDAIEAILTRRSIRKYTDKKISKELIDVLLHAAMHAPSARNCQPWHFVVVTERNVLDELAVVHPYGKMLKQARLAILVCGDRFIEESDNYINQNCSAATQNILLAAHANGLGAVWLGVYPRKQRMKGISKLLILPEHILPISLISIGYPAEMISKPERFKHERIHYNNW